MVHKHNGILFSHKKKTNPTIFNNMDGARGYYAQWNQPGRERQVPNDFPHLWNITAKQNWRDKTVARLTGSKNGLAVTKGEGWGRVGVEGGRRGLRGIIISTHNIGRSQGRQYSMEKMNKDSIASSYTDGQWLQWGWGGLDNMGECWTHSVAHIKVS